MTAPALPEPVSRGTRCFLGTDGPEGPQVAAMACWSDGAALWMSAAATTFPTTAPRLPGCVAYVPPVVEHGPGAVVHGTARVYSLRDPLGLVLHTPTISAAMTALAAANPAAVLGAVQDAARAPHRSLPRNRVFLRLLVAQVAEVDPPDVGPGVAPALPTVAPADVRRRLAGLRRVVVVYRDGDGLHAAPGVWGAGYTLRLPASRRPPPDARAVVAVDTEGGSRPSRAVGLAVHGRIGADGRLVPDRVSSWQGPHCERAEVASPAPGGVVLPD